MGLSCATPKPGDYLTMEHGMLPILLVQGDDRVARAFINNRGAPVAKGCGRTANFTCADHAWTCSRSGDLKLIPD